MPDIRKIVFGTCCLMLLNISFVAASPYATFDFDDIDAWVGTGANQAALVLDWNTPTGNSSFVWGYRWDGAATGEDMLRAIAGVGNYADSKNGDFVTHGADPRLSFNSTVFSGLGGFVVGFAFDSPTSGTLGYPDSFDWNYYTATSLGSWSNASEGLSSRALSNGVWDGFRYAPGFDENFNPVTFPSLPLAVQPVPEPSTYAVLAVGLTVVALFRLRRVPGPSRSHRV